MSVINQMLKDLEKRQQNVDDGTNQPMPTPKLDYQKPSTNRTKIWLWCCLSLILGSGLTYGLMNWQSLSQHISASAQSEKAEGDASAEITQANSPELKGKNLNGSEASLPVKSIETGIQVASNRELNANTESRAPELGSTTLGGAVDDKAPLVGKAKIRIPKNTAEEPASQNQLVRANLAQERERVVPQSLEQSKNVEKVPKKELPKPQLTITPVVLTKAQLVSKEMQKAEVLESRGMLEQAMLVYHNVLKQEAAQHTARKKLASLLYGQSRFSQAKQVLIQGQALYPEQQEYLLLLARVYLAANDSEQAMATLAKMKDSGAEAKQKWLQISTLAQKTGDFPKAETAFRQLATLEPNQGRWWMGLAYALDSQQSYKEALGAYQQASDSQHLSSKSRQFVENRMQVLGDYQ